MTNDSAFSSFSDRLLHCLSREPILISDTEFNQLASDLFALQFEHVPEYRRFCELRGVAPDRVSDWRQIPPLPTSAFKELVLSSLPPSQRAHVFFSSGTTGQQPSRHFHSGNSLRVYEASILPWLRIHLLPELPIEQDVRRTADPVGHPDLPSVAIILTPPPEQAPNSSLVHMFDVIRRRFEFASCTFYGGCDEEERWTVDFNGALHALENGQTRHQACVLFGTAFSFVNLLDRMSDRGQRLRLPRGSRVLETGGYKGRSRVLTKAELRSHITAHLGITPNRIVSEYGMSELSSQAYDRVASSAEGHDSSNMKAETGLFRFPPWVRVRLISPETGWEVSNGQTGLVQVVDLANVRSVAAVQTEDLAIRRDPGFELVGRAVEAEPRGCSLMAP
jgi:acyl-CoA synthetase (AMP-forming)/AMP-acid ligase II